jgi:peptide/nickel transport system substrate-binding protein
VLPSHRLDSIPFTRVSESAIARHPVGTGRFRFAQWDAGQRIEVVADTANPRGRAHLDRVVWNIASDQGVATVKLFAGEADLLEGVRSDNLAQLARTPTLRVVANRGLSYFFMGFNLHDAARRTQPHPIFSDGRVRRALTYAVDRPRLAQNVFDSLALVAIAPAPRALIADTTAIPSFGFDAAHARALLDSAGWRDTNGDGIRERDGRALAFELIAPAPAMALVRYATLLQQQFRDVGANVTTLTLEGPAFGARTDARRFDAFLSGWAPSPGLLGLRQTWASRGNSNEVGYASAQFDAYLDSALTAFDRADSRRLWGRAFATIVNDAPGIWLYEGRAPLAVHRRFIVPPLRADGWWSELADWRVDPAQRIARDRIGVGTGVQR